MSHALCVILFFFFALGKRHDPSFLGKIRGNVLNTKYVAYDNGVHPTQKSTGIARRELAFINYTLLDDAPREMEVVVPKILSDGYVSTHIVKLLLRRSYFWTATKVICPCPFPDAHLKSSANPVTTRTFCKMHTGRTIS